MDMYNFSFEEFRILEIEFKGGRKSYARLNPDLEPYYQNVC